MGDNSMYWSDQQSAWAYQQPIAPRQAPPPPPPPPYAVNSYSHPGQLLPNEQATPTPPPQTQQQQHPTPPSQAHPQQHPHNHPHHHQQPIQHHHQHQLVPNGLPNGNSHPQMPNQQQANQPQPGVPQQQQMNHRYNSHLSNLHHEPPNVSMQPHHQLDQTNFQTQHQQQAYQPPNQQQQQHQPPLPPQPAPMYSQSTGYPGMVHAQTGQSLHHSTMQQQQQQPTHQSPYPTQQYSPPSYWSSVPPMHNQQTNYGPPSASQGPIQSVPTPPQANSDNTYHTANNLPQQPHPPPPSNMPYESRGPNMSANYSSPYPNQQLAPSYYNPHEVQPQPADPYEMPPSHQAPPPPPPSTTNQPWSNGYYQPNQAPYPDAANMYSMPYNGSSAAPSQPPPISQPPLHGGLSNQHVQHPQYHHQQAQQPQQWPSQNHIMPAIERNKSTDKKPVKPRAPKKQSNPNAPSGRRKRQPMTEEHKQSGYAKFYQTQRKTLPKNLEFGEISRVISENWAQLSPEQRNHYVKDVSIKRKEMLKKKASQQAQDLLVQGTKPEPDLVREIKQQPGPI